MALASNHKDQIVEFDIGQLRAIQYETKADKDGEFDIIEHNFDE